MMWLFFISAYVAAYDLHCLFLYREVYDGHCILPTLYDKVDSAIA